MSGSQTLRARRAAWQWATAAAMMLAAGEAAGDSVVTLHEDQPLTLEQGAADRFDYDVTVDAPGDWLLRVDQRGLDLIVTITAPDGTAQSYNSPTFRDGAEVVVLGAAPGRYRVVVHSDESTDARGAHTVVLTSLRAAEPRVREAWRLVATGGRANFSGGKEGWAQAVDAYERAAAIWHDLGRAREEADALFAVATIEYWQRSAWVRSANVAARAAETYGSLGEAALGANAVHLQAAALVEQALAIRQSSDGAAIAPESEELFAEALRLLEQARRTHEELGDLHDLGLVVNNFGYTYYNKGDFEHARAYYEQAAALQESAGEWGAETLPLANIAVLDAEAGRLTGAIATFEKILRILPPGRLLRTRASTLDNLGATHLVRGDAEQALQIFADGLELERKLDDEQGEGRALRRIGEAYYVLGELDLAKQYLEQALPIAVRRSDGRTQEATLRNLGNVAFLESDYAGALDFHRRALEISASTSDRAHLQLLVAKDSIALGRAPEAQQAAAVAAEVARGTGSDWLRAAALNAGGRARLLAGQPAAATADLEQAAALFERLGMRAEHAEALHGLSLAARAQHRLDEAIRYGSATLDDLELLRLRVADPELRALFGAARRDYFETQIELLMERAERPSDQYARAAFEVSERGRARMIVDLLEESAVDVRASADPSSARETALYERLADRRRQRDLLLERQVDGEHPAAALQPIVAELASVENELNLIEIDKRRGNPSYESLTAPKILKAAAVQERLGADTVLLQYALGTKRSYVWVVTSDRVVAIPLAGREAIEQAARRALARLESPDAGGASGSPSAELSEVARLVLEPVAPYLDRSRIALALDGALQFVPFGVLPLARGDAATEPLLAAHEVVEVPSMSVLALSARTPHPTNRRALAVFADPVLDAGDPRFGTVRAAALPVAETPAAGFAARSSLVAPLGRLLATGYEGAAIASLLPSDAVLLARGFAASRDAVLAADLRPYRYIHFATHGLVDARYPRLSALVLSQFDERGRPRDGFLRLADIYNLKLDADLVVLSACDTALGREVHGEGLIGLTQGFISAGAHSVVATLWQVPDGATAALMRQFYAFMLSGGDRPAEALRKAQMWSASQRRSRDPYYWGGFVLVGDWR